MEQNGTDGTNTCGVDLEGLKIIEAQVLVDHEEDGHELDQEGFETVLYYHILDNRMNLICHQTSHCNTVDI
jgi:hypothetical protein